MIENQTRRYRIMVKTVKGKTKTTVYDTATTSIVKKVTSGVWGDPAGYETTLYVTEAAEYFLYTYGGEASAYAKEKITTFTKANAQKWLAEN